MKRKVLQGSSVLLAAASLFGCANYEVNSGRGSVPGYWIRHEMQEADRAIEEARAAGKDKQCPEEFGAAEDAKNKAYDVFRACNTEPGAALAKEATAKAKALCPARPVVLVPAPAPVVEPAPKPVPPPAPTNWLTVNPATIVAGNKATLNWGSQNATSCGVEPGLGSVALQGSMSVAPQADSAYTLVCNGPGGSATSRTDLSVVAPAPVVVPPAPVVAPAVVAPAAKLCEPAVADIHFDTNKYNIKPQYHDELKRVADFLKEFPKATGVIEGHTDSVGDKAANMKLSQRRADSVRSYLVDKFGIAGDRIKAIGYGPTKPIADNSTRAGKEKNRRIETNFKCD